MSNSTSWRATAPNRDWYSGLDWTNGVPTADDQAQIVGALNLVLRLAPSAQVAPETVGTLTISQAAVALYGGALDFKPTLQKNAATDDLVLAKGASLTVFAGATLSGDQTIRIGADGSNAVLRVQGAVEEDDVVVSSGRLIVAGDGHWTAGASGVAVGGGGELLVAGGGLLDGGRADLRDPGQSLTLGNGIGSGKAVVTGEGSRLSLTDLYVGNFYDGSLTVSDGGVVQDQIAVVNGNGDGKVLVTGQGSRWDSFGTLTLGGAYPTNSSITITNYGQVDWSQLYFRLDDSLYLDGTAVLGGQAIYDGGEVIALSNAQAEEVQLRQDIYIASNWLFDFANVASFSAEGAALLQLDGQILGDATSVLRIGAGHVAVTDGGDSFGSSQIYGGELDVDAAGALGAGAVDFTGGKATHALLEIETTAPFSNLIEDLGATDRIGLAYFSIAQGVTKTWDENAAHTAGTLSLLSGGVTLTLQIAGDHKVGDFRVASDAAIGTYVTLAPPSA